GVRPALRAELELVDRHRLIGTEIGDPQQDRRARPPSQIEGGALTTHPPGADGGSPSLSGVLRRVGDVDAGAPTAARRRHLEMAELLGAVEDKHDANTWLPCTLDTGVV